MEKFADSEDEGKAVLHLEGEHQIDVCTLLCLKNQMKQQLTEYSTVVQNLKENDLENITEEEYVKGDVSELGKVVNNTVATFWNKTLALLRIQLADTMLNELNHSGNDSQEIMETLEEIGKLSKEVNKHHQEVCEKEQKLIAIRRRRFSLKKAEKQKLLQIETMKKQKMTSANTETSRVLKNMHRKLEEERVRATMLQRVLQNIILGSGVNWAEDASLKAVVLGLEKKY